MTGINGGVRSDHFVTRGIAGEKGVDIFDYAHAHCLARLHRGTAQMRQQHDIFHRQQIGRYRRFLFENIEPCPSNISIIQRSHQCRFVDDITARAVEDLPLEAIHKLAFKAAEATHCAEDQGKFWEMHDRLFTNQRALEPWSGHAEAVGIDVAAFDACLESGKHAAAIREDMATAGKTGARGTPSFLLAKTDPTDPTKITGIVALRGAQPFNNFKLQIDQALSSLN